MNSYNLDNANKENIDWANWYDKGKGEDYRDDPFFRLVNKIRDYKQAKSHIEELEELVTADECLAVVLLICAGADYNTAKNKILDAKNKST